MAEQLSQIKVLLAVMLVVLAFTVLNVTQPVTLPLAFAGVLLILFRPLQRLLNAYLPTWVSPLIITLLVLALFALFWAALTYSVTLVVPEIPQYAERLEPRVQAWRTRLTAWVPSTQGEPQNGPGGGDSTSQIAQRALDALGGLATSLSLSVLVLTLLVFLLYELGPLRTKFQQVLATPQREGLADAFTRMTQKFSRYVWVTAFTSLLTGLLTVLWCWALGIELAFVWGLAAFVLNFVPTIGSIIAVVPPTLFASAFGGFWLGLAALLGLGVMQLVMGNFVNPKLIGEALQLSPLVVLLAVVFWGWLWGVGGAIIGVPLTMALVLICQEFDALRPVAVLLGQVREERS